MRVLPLALIALTVSAGCVSGPLGPVTTGPTGGTNAFAPLDPSAPVDFGRTITVGGRIDAPPGNEAPTLTMQLATLVGCDIIGVVWHEWTLPVDREGRFGPLTVPEPKGNGTILEFIARAAGANEVHRAFGAGDYGNVTRMGTIVLALEPTWNVTVHAAPLALVALARANASAVRATDWTVTGPSGTVRFEGLVRGASYDVVAARPSGESARARVSDATDLTLRAASSAIRGRITFAENGANVGDDVPVFAHLRGANGSLSLASAARTDKDGSFVLPVDAPGTYTLEARGQVLRNGQGYRATNVTVDVPAGATNVTRDLSIGLQKCMD